MNAVIVDVDGTIADNSHRQIYVRSTPKNWAAYNTNMHLDKPIHNVIDAIRCLQLKYAVLIVTAREEVHRSTTVKWLCDHLDFPYTKLYMRPQKDYREDSLVKAELLDKIISDGFAPKIVFDDRDKVVKMWREKGLTCFQVNYGDF